MKNTAAQRLAAWMERTFKPYEEQRPVVFPAGAIPTGAFKEQLWVYLQQLDANLSRDPSAYRTLMLDSVFSNGHTPDYSNENTAYLYLGMFGLSYALEYYLIYLIALKMLRACAINDAAVYTFGCGSMIDAWPLSWANEALGSPMDLSYTGIDLITWPACFAAPLPQQFVQKPMEELWDDASPFNGNLLFFPKMLSEIPEQSDTIKRFCDGIRKTDFGRDTIALCISYRSSSNFREDWRIPEWCKAQEIIKALEDKGYSCAQANVTPSRSLGMYLRQELAEAETGTSYPFYYVRSETGNVPIARFAPDFLPDPRLESYLTDPSEIRRHCSFFEGRVQRYHEKYPDSPLEKVSPINICKACCPIRCATKTRIKIRRSHDACFQVLLFTR